MACVTSNGTMVAATCGSRLAAWAIRSRFDGLAGLGTRETPALARAWAEAVRGLLATLATAALGLGLIDYAMQRQRFAAMLRLTPEQSREDQKAMDGDPSTPAGLLAALATVEVVPGRATMFVRAWTPIAKAVNLIRGNGRVEPKDGAV